MLGSFILGLIGGILRLSVIPMGILTVIAFNDGGGAAGGFFVAVTAALFGLGTFLGYVSRQTVKVKG